MNTSPKIPVAIGEIFDKYSILEIKLDKINDINKLKHVKTEMSCLEEFISKYKLPDEIYNRLKTINQLLWNIEDNIRDKEAQKEFDNEFIQLARNVYITNDQRCLVKQEINKYFNSTIYEVKSYKGY